MKLVSVKKGFTLVEIMIVVAIIGIIIAIAVPAFLRARENARGRACQENLTKIDGAKEQYAIEKRLANETDVTLLNLGDAGDMGSGYLKSTPNCPAGGTYKANAIGSDPTCTLGVVGAGVPTWAVQHVLPGGTLEAAADPDPGDPA